MSLDYEQAWHEGVNIRTALRCAPEQTRAAVIRMVKDVVDFIEAKRTLTSLEDFMFTAEAIYKQHPTLKLEELAACCRDMKLGLFGKYYERLKTPEFLEALCKVEADRASILERTHREPPTRGLRPGQEVIAPEVKKLTDVMRERSNIYAKK